MTWILRIHYYDNLDLDYIETLIRERLLFGKKNEKIYIIKENEN